MANNTTNNAAPTTKSATNNAAPTTKSGVPLSCPLPASTAIQINSAVSQPVLTEMQKRAANLAQRLNNNTLASGSEALRLRNQLLNNMARVGDMVATSVLRPQNTDRLGSFLARTFGVQRRMLGLGDEYTTAGWVRESVNRVGELWRGSIRSTLHDLGVYELVTNSKRNYDEIFRKYGLTAKQRAEIVFDSTETGWYPYLQQMADINPVYKNHLAQQASDFADRLVTMYGLSPEDAARVIMTGQEMAHGFHIAGDVAVRAGADFDLVKTIGYAPRNFDPKFQERLNWRIKKEPGRGSLFEFDDGTKMGSGTAITQSRSTYNWTVVDEAVLDDLLRTSSSRKYGGSETEMYRRVLDAPEGATPSLTEVIQNPEAMRRLVFNELEPSKVNELVELGILAKLPMLTTQIADDLIRSLDLPVNGLAEMLVTDPVQMLEAWTRQLETSMRASGHVNLLFRRIMDGDWGVSARAFAENPQKYKDYVPLVEVDGRPGVISNAMAERFGIRTLMEGDGNVLLQGAYVHPVAANMVRAQLDAATNPTYLGAVGEFLVSLNRNFRNLVIISTGFIPRQYINSSMMVLAAGGNPLQMFQDGIRVAKHYLSGRPIWEAYSDAKVYAGGLSARDIVRRMSETGFIDDFEPLFAERIGQTGKRASVPLTQKLDQARRWAEYAAREFGDWGRSVQEFGAISITGEIGKEAIAFWQVMNNAADVTGRIATVLSTMKHADGSANVLDSVFTGIPNIGRRYNTVDEAIENAQNYFYWYNNTTKLNDGLRQIIPFWGFHSRNIPAAIRHAMRYPSKYAAMNRAIAMSNQAQMHGTDDLNESTVPEWMLHTRPLYYSLQDGSGRTHWFGVSLTSLDPFSSAYEEWLLEPTQAAFDALGIWQDSVQEGDDVYRRQRGTTSERLNDSVIGRDTQNAFFEMVQERLFPQITAIADAVSEGVAAARGENRNIYAPPNTFLGIEMPVVMENLISAFMPLAGTLNRVNPRLPGQDTRIFGERGYYDQSTGAYVPDRVSPWTGNIRTDNDTFNRLIDSGAPGAGIARVADFAGVRVHPIDYLTNAGYTLKDIEATLRQARNIYKQYARNAQRFPPGSRQHQQAVEGMELTRTMYAETLRAYMELEQWMLSKGYDQDVVDTIIRNGQREAHELRVPLDAQRTEEYNELIRTLDNDDEQ